MHPEPVCMLWVRLHDDTRMHTECCMCVNVCAHTRNRRCNVGHQIRGCAGAPCDSLRAAGGELPHGAGVGAHESRVRVARQAVPTCGALGPRASRVGSQPDHHARSSQLRHVGVSRVGGLLLGLRGAATDVRAHAAVRGCGRGSRLCYAVHSDRLSRRRGRTCRQLHCAASSGGRCCWPHRVRVAQYTPQHARGARVATSHADVSW